MSRTVPGLKRLIKLYTTLEHLDTLHVLAARNSVGEVTKAAARLDQAHRVSAEQGRVGLSHGSRVDSLAAQVTAPFLDERRSVLAALHKQRENAHRDAVSILDGVRRDFRQVEMILERQQTKMLVETERRSQSTSDDRFLSQRRGGRPGDQQELL